MIKNSQNKIEKKEKKEKKPNQPTNQQTLMKAPWQRRQNLRLLVSSSLLDANSFTWCQLALPLSSQSNKNVLRSIVDRIRSFSYSPFARFIWIELLVYMCRLLLCVHSLHGDSLKNTSILCQCTTFLALFGGKVYSSQARNFFWLNH